MWGRKAVKTRFEFGHCIWLVDLIESYLTSFDQSITTILDRIGSKQRVKGQNLSPGRDQAITRISLLGGSTTTPRNQVPFDIGDKLLFIIQVSQAFS